MVRYSRHNVAYRSDFNHGFNAQKPSLKLVKSKSTKILGMSSFQVIMLLIVLISMASYLVFSKLTLDKIGDEIVRYEKEYENLTNEKIRLEVDAESKVSLKNVEDLANEKGLCAIQDYQVEYVDFKSEDNIELANKKVGVFAYVKSFFDKLLAYMK